MWVKGQSGNPKGGKPKAEQTREKLLRMLGEENIDAALKADFASGNKVVRQFVYDHVYGKPVQRAENTHEFPDKITFEIVRPDASADPAGA